MTLSFPNYRLKTWHLPQIFYSNDAGHLSLEHSNSIIILAIIFFKLPESNSYLPFLSPISSSCRKYYLRSWPSSFSLPGKSSAITILDPLLEIQPLVFSHLLNHLHQPPSGRSGVQICPELSSLLKGFSEEYIQLLTSSNSKQCQDFQGCCSVLD